jgi:hypothetical protein
MLSSGSSLKIHEEKSMLCHPYPNRVECHADKKPQVVEPQVGESENRVEFLKALHAELAGFFEKKKVSHVAIEYPNLGIGRKNINRHVGEVTGVVVGAALLVGASVEKA